MLDIFRRRRMWRPSGELKDSYDVVIVGGGSHGLAAAYYLLQKGHRVTLWDASPEPGGMLRYGIPAYRLPKDALDDEIEVIRALGASFRMGSRWGHDFSLADLRARFD